MGTQIYGTHVLVHLDMKGAPPKLSYLEQFFSFIRVHGATGILLEWEDTFPYENDLVKIGSLSETAEKCGAPYSKADAERILEMAAECNLLVIPLVQTFGHLEFVLKHEEWSHLREVENYPSSMCPTQAGAMALVKDMLRQVVGLHVGLRYIHIGADEVWHLGRCSECARRSAASEHGRASLFLDHVAGVARFVQNAFPGLQVLMWDDMLRDMDGATLREYGMGRLVQPMVWHYSGRRSWALGPTLWAKYGAEFGQLWGASAFKGAAGSCQVLAPAPHYADMQQAWLEELAALPALQRTFQGLALTGWSRYDHCAALCELLPAAEPSLALCLRTWRAGGTLASTADAVFPGAHALAGLEWLMDVRTRYKALADGDQLRTWLTPWLVRHNRTNPMQIEGLAQALTALGAELVALDRHLRVDLGALLHTAALDEVLDGLLTPVQRHVGQLSHDCAAQLARGCRPGGP